jgi:hypothetical protein
MFGLLAYPAMGIYRSIGAAMSPLRKQVLAARLAHDEWMAGRVALRQDEVDAVLAGFDG